MKKSSESSLPPGFRFHPTDEELILHYLSKRANSCPLPVSIVAEVDIYKFDPWDLPAKAAFGEKEWYFFSPRDRKYPNGARPNRAAASGYWKATGTDKTIVTSLGPHHQHNVTIGVKKALVFYKGRPPKGVKTSWIMHEYRLSDSNLPKPNVIKDSSMRLDDWVLCRIYKKTNAAVHVQPCDEDEQDQHFLPHQKSSSFSNLLDAVDYSMLTSLLSDCPTTASTTLAASTGFEYDQAPGSGGYLDQLYLNGCPTNSNSYVTQKQPQMQLSSNKRQLPSHEDELLCPSKRYLSSCSTFMQSNVPLQTQNINVHMNPMLLDHQFFLSPEL